MARDCQALLLFPPLRVVNTPGIANTPILTALSGFREAIMAKILEKQSIS
jgi:hypothetical protein